MNIIYDCWKDNMNTVLSSLNINLRYLLDTYKDVQIGITDDPDHIKSNNSNWDYMLVKYESEAPEFVSSLEYHLMKFKWHFVKKISSTQKKKKYFYILIRS